MDSAKLFYPPQKWLLAMLCDSPSPCPRLAVQFVLILTDICVLLDRHLPASFSLRPWNYVLEGSFGK